jgi:hypothetical protein
LRRIKPRGKSILKGESVFIKNVSADTVCSCGKVPNLLSGYTENNRIHNKTTVDFAFKNGNKK